PRRGSEKGWLYTIALNRLSDLDRRNAAERRAVEQVGAGGELQGANPLDVIERRTTLGAALDGLSVQEREAVALRFGGDLALKEMAQVTGEAVTTVEGRLYRALRKLRSALE
ncbi:MAG: RNA polymerase subunit sigma-24, partial [Pseudonocardiales bacterium]